jgi:hypothetical protein
MGWHGDLFDRGAESREALRAIAHLRLNVGLALGRAEALLDHANAKIADPMVEGVEIGRHLGRILSRVEAVGPGDDRLRENRVLAL